MIKDCHTHSKTLGVLQSNLYPSTPGEENSQALGCPNDYKFYAGTHLKIVSSRIKEL